MMKRDSCLKVLAQHAPDDIVVAVYQAAFEWRVIRPSPLNYVEVGAMGQASSHGLGLALGLPQRRVIVLDGDGSLLMNLGTLVTIGEQAPKNLFHFVCENGTYEANGGHPIPGKGRVSFAGIARAAGIGKVHEFAELQDFAARIGDVLREEGPVFAVLKVEPGERYPQDYDGYLHSPEPRRLFREAVARLK